MRKRTIALLVLLAALVGLAVSQVYSYTLKTVETDNIIAYGALKMRLIQVDETRSSVPLRGGEPIRLIASEGDTVVTRDISVENICDQPMYLRLKLTVAGEDREGNPLSLTGDQATYTVDNGAGWLPRETEDGWYYYKEILQPHQTTGSLLTDNTVTFHNTKAIAKDHPGLSLHIDVEVQAVQSVHNPEGVEDVFRAQGWPEEVAKP